ncbi:MAG: ribonuclease 2-5A-domain-containing protein, partial [Olpidium bornovanus]
SLKIVHRDIKPQNVLIAKGRNNAKVGSAASALLHSPHNGHKSHPRALLSDFGLCKRLEHDQSSFNNMTHAAASVGAAGTIGWRAPECLLALGSGQQIVLGGDSRSSLPTSDDVPQGSGRSGARITKAIDIFSAGCLFYYVLSGGEHPFGERYERESNILKNLYDLGKLELLGPEGLEARDLVERMISADPKLRPTAPEILAHPYFWSPAKRLAFLMDCSDRFEVECRDPPSPLLAALESRAHRVFGPGENWQRRLDRPFVESLGKYRKYDFRSIRDLLRALRNKRHHYQDAPDALKRLFGPTAETFLAYFRSKFPNLFIHVYGVVRSDPKVRQEHLFRPYFENPTNRSG